MFFYSYLSILIAHILDLMVYRNYSSNTKEINLGKMIHFKFQYLRVFGNFFYKSSSKIWPLDIWLHEVWLIIILIEWYVAFDCVIEISFIIFKHLTVNGLDINSFEFCHASSRMSLEIGNVTWSWNIDQNIAHDFSWKLSISIKKARLFILSESFHQ